jgi:hypothetical protein
MKAKLIAACVALFFLAVVGAQTPGPSKAIPAELQVKYWKLVAQQHRAGNVRTAARAKADSDYDATIKRLVADFEAAAAEAAKVAGCAIVENDDGLACAPPAPAPPPKK